MWPFGTRDIRLRNFDAALKNKALNILLYIHLSVCSSSSCYVPDPVLGAVGFALILVEGKGIKHTVT